MRRCARERASSGAASASQAHSWRKPQIAPGARHPGAPGPADGRPRVRQYRLQPVGKHQHGPAVAPDFLGQLPVIVQYVFTGHRRFRIHGPRNHILPHTGKLSVHQALPFGIPLRMLFHAFTEQRTQMPIDLRCGLFLQSMIESLETAPTLLLRFAACEQKPDFKPAFAAFQESQT